MTKNSEYENLQTASHDEITRMAGCYSIRRDKKQMDNKSGPNGAFWQTKTLDKMTADEWESLCDRCGKCCLLKLEDADTAEIYTTDVACKLLDCGTAQCTNYKQRKRHVPDCTMLTPQTVSSIHWLPANCAYRLVANGQPLPLWHPLITGDAHSTSSGNSVAGRVFPEEAIDDEDMIDHIYDWEAKQHS